MIAMDEMHSHYVEVISNEVEMLDQSQIPLAVLEQFSQSIQSKFAEMPEMKLEISEKEEFIPMLEITNTTKQKLNQRQIDKAKDLIDKYTKAGLEMLQGFAEIVREITGSDQENGVVHVEDQSEKNFVKMIDEEQPKDENSQQIDEEESFAMISTVKGRPTNSKVQEFDFKNLNFDDESEVNQDNIYASDDELEQIQKNKNKALKNQKVQQLTLQKRNESDEMFGDKKRKMIPAKPRSRRKVDVNGYGDENYYKRIQNDPNNPNQDFSDGPSGRKRKAMLSEAQIRDLQLDLRKPNLNRFFVARKYDISESTLNRYIRKFGLQKSGEFKQQQRSVIKFKPAPIVRTRETLSISNSKRSEMSYVPRPIEEDNQSDRLIKKNSKVRLVEQKVIEIYRKYPNIYQAEVAQMLTKHYDTEISVHVVSRCLKNIQIKRREEMERLKQEQLKQDGQNQKKSYAHLDQNSQKNLGYRYLYSKQLMSLNQQQVIYIDELVHRLNDKEGEQCDKINFVVAFCGGRIVHWKVKHHSFKPAEIGTFLKELGAKYKGYMMILDNAKIHKTPEVKASISTNGLKILYIPPFSAQLNPVEKIINTFSQRFRKKDISNLKTNDVLREANQVFVDIKEIHFYKQVEETKGFVNMAYRKQPFPFERTPQ